MKSSSSPGPDNIPSCILNNCADNLFYPLFILFNKSLNISYFPEIWKESYIIPLHKSGNKNEVSNYRGNAKLSSISKLFGQIRTNQLKFLILQIIFPHQHGFLKHHSVETNLFEFVVNIYKLN